MAETALLLPTLFAGGTATGIGSLGTAALTAGVAGAGAAAASSLLAPDTPTPEPVKRMPDPFGTEAAAAEKKKALGRKGRGSTLLDDEDSYAAPTYVHDVLGE